MLKVEILDYNTQKDYIDKHFDHLLLDSFNNDCSHNGYTAVNSLEDMFKRIGTTMVLVVFRLSKYIGFFFNPIVDDKVGIKLFRFSYSCPMSSRSLIKAAFLRSIGLCINNQEHISSVDFSVWHPSLTHILKAIIPFIKIDNINSDYIVCHYTFKEEDIPKLVIILSKYLGNPEEIDIDDFDVVL